ncbi:hypothetical protein MtrunA17_Chr2g0309571 [Medicago truncatula]|uniref:Transmembrane protein n=1 Tax=Medicago truncatula TaxID=3880 RepID=A0A396J8C8_MEDTR|nr:hypothetical protein MtrunA17_Chr2g0309571 [Medicago truncatula]
MHKKFDEMYENDVDKMHHHKDYENEPFFLLLYEILFLIFFLTLLYVYYVYVYVGDYDEPFSYI